MFGLTKRRSTQPAMLSVSASSPAVGDELGASSRRPSAVSAAVGKRGSSVSCNVPHAAIVHAASHTAGSVPLVGAESTSTDHESVSNHVAGEEHGGEERSRSGSSSGAASAVAASVPRFTCPLCKRQLSEPRVLPCLHAFCTACLKELDSMPSEAAGSEIALWNGETEGSRTPKAVEAGGGGGSSAGSGYESEEPAGVWSPLASRRWRRGGPSGAASGGAVPARLLVCPTCGAEARIPTGGVLMFPLHHVLQQRMLLASLARDAARAAGSLLCDLCSTDVQASARCSDCLVSLCTFCSEAHQRQRRTAAHLVLSLHEARRRGMRGVRQPHCPAHPGQEMRFFCEPCGQLACRDCCVTLHRDHRPPCEPVARVAPPYLAAMRDALDRARPLAEGVRAALERLHILEQRIQGKASTVQQEVDSHIDSWMAALEAHRHTLTLQVRKARDSKLQAVRTQQLELERRSGDVSAAVRFADELLAEGSEAEVMSTVSPLLRRLEWCATAGSAAAAAAGGSVGSSSSSSTAGGAEQQQPSPASLARISDCLMFLPTEVSGRTAEGLPLFGVISTQTCSASHCRIDMDALATCRQHKRSEVLLVTRDSDNQPIGHGGADIAVEMRARDPTRRPLSVQVTDRGDGTYLMSFMPDSAGKYALSVLVQNKPIHGSPFLVYVRPLRPHSGIFHCCTFCSSNGSKDVPCGCGAQMPGGYRGCGHGHTGHPGRRHWSCCGSVLESSECGRGTVASPSVYQFPL